MNSTYTVHPDLRIFVTRYRGMVHDEEFLALYRKILSDPAIKPGFNELADLRECDAVDINADTMRSVQDMTAEFLARERVEMNTAVIAPSSFNFGITRMYELIGDQTPESVSVFRNPREALDCLGLPATLTVDELHSEDPQET